MTFTNLEGLGYWLRCQVPVCALIIVAPSVLASYVIKKVKTEPLFFGDFWKPQWRKHNPCRLLCYRAFAFICLARILYEIVALDGDFAFYSTLSKIISKPSLIFFLFVL